MLRGRSCEAFAVGDGELIHGLFPFLRCSSPVGRDVAQRQPQQLGGGIVTGKVPTRLDDLAQPAVQTLDGVARVDHAAHRRAEGKERNHAVPGPAPGRHDGGELLSPGSGLQGIELGRCRLRTGCRIDRLQGCGQRLAVLPTRKVQAFADQVHDAGLQRSGREHRRQRLGNALEAVGDGDYDVGHAACLEVVEHLHPEVGSLVVLDLNRPRNRGGRLV
jgi:hypothetical protein